MSINAHARRLLASALALSIMSSPVLAQPSATPPVTGPGTAAPLPTPASPGATAPTGAPGAATPGLGVPTPPRPSTPPVVRTPLTGADREALKDVEGEFNHFIEAGEKHQGRMRDLMSREYTDRTRTLEKKFAERMAKIDSDKAKRHAKTTALLEKFIVDHPDQKQFTPDAMFRLADLYIDNADADVDNRPASDAADPAAIIADYSKAVKLWEDILARFPNYRQLAPTLYLLAYYSKQTDPRRSLTLFLALTCANKVKYTDAPTVAPDRREALARVESRTLRDPYADCKAMEGAETELVRHAWVRGIADYHFGIPGELDDSIAAYGKVANGGSESSLYPEALYKIAWSFYKRDFLFESIKKFDESVKLYDGIASKGGTPSLELRDEAIQYISVGFTDPWEGETDTDPVKALQRAKDFYKGREAEPHVRDVWVAMGRAFNDLQAYDQAVDAYRIAIGPPWELDPKNPQVHQEIVNTFEAKGDKFAADGAAAELATRYAPGSPWFAANEKDREAMENQRRIAERALYAAARNTHSAATNARKEYDAAAKKDPNEKVAYLAMYERAVGLYRTFILQYPESDYVYEFTFMQGEALYFSERYLEAVEQYKWVRDHRDMSEQFFLSSAQSILQSYEAEAARQVAEGKVTALKVPTSAELKALPQPLTPQPIPEIYQLLQNEWDTYQNVVNDPKTAPEQGINAALVSLAYLRIDDSVVRFQKVMDKFCGNPEAVKAKDALLGVYEATDQLNKFEATNKKFIATKCGDAKSIELAKSQNQALEFKRANALYAEKQFIPAAEMYYRYYKTAPSTDSDLPIALYNSAVAYKLGDRPKTAISMFKEFTVNKDKRFRESPFYLDAMRLTALSYQGAFEYDKAVSTYLDLYDTAQKAQKLGIKPPEPLPGEKPLTLNQIALDSLFNAAFAAELNRDYKKAIDLYGRYEREETDGKKRDSASWSIANIYKSSGDATSFVGQLDKWRRGYGKNGGNEERYVQSFYDSATLWKRKGKQSNAEKAGAECIDAWKQRGAVRGGNAAKMAGEWTLYFAEKYYNDTYEPFAITKAAKTVDEAKAQGAAIKDATAKAQDKYLQLDAYGVAEYSMAAKVRYGETVYKYAGKLSEVPIPTPVAKNPDAMAAYEQKRDADLAKYLLEAKSQWSAVVDLSRKSGVANRWSQLALENLGREFPGEYQVLRQEIIEGTEAP
jgi:cellulose synthase operon protein C